MIVIVITSLIAIAVIAYILGVRPQDLPEPEPESPFAHFDERKAAIYENLRDLQFEYRVGKLSDQDYQNTKRDLQKELANVLMEVDKLKAELGLNGTGVPKPQAKAQPGPHPQSNGHSGSKSNLFVCDACGAKFEQALKFCGECGKPMKAVKA